jgi:sigma-E factor negative regulatory protein RseA
MTTETELEQVSALVDGALDVGTERALLARLGEQPALRARWGRYHLIGDVLRGEAVAGAALDVAARVREQLASEPVVIAPARTRLRRRPAWLRPAIGLAAAASFGAAMVVVLPRHEAPTGQPAVATAVPVAPPAGQAVERPVEWQVVQQGPITRWQAPRPGVDGDLHRFLTDHSEFAATGVKGAMPLATLVGYGARR